MNWMGTRMKRTAFLMASSCALALMVGGQIYASETKTKTASSDTADTADTADLREKDIEEIVVSSSVIGTRLIDSLQGIFGKIQERLVKHVLVGHDRRQARVIVTKDRGIRTGLG